MYILEMNKETLTESSGLTMMKGDDGPWISLHRTMQRIAYKLTHKGGKEPRDKNQEEETFYSEGET